MPQLKLSKAYKDTMKKEGSKESTDDVQIKRHKGLKPVCIICNHTTKEKGKRFGHKDKSNLHYFCKIDGRLAPSQVVWK